MTGLAARPSGRSTAKLDYRAAPASREGLASRLPLRLFAACFAGLSALSTAACSMSFPLDSMMPADPVTTGSIGPVSPLAPELDAEDWRRARAALSVALDPQGNGARASWDNPDSGRGGAFVPAALPYVKDDRVCRDFLAELDLLAERREVTGSACRLSGGEWRIHEVEEAGGKPG